jgi:ribosomal protein S18 acetylase RimI-like enzyme
MIVQRLETPRRAFPTAEIRMVENGDLSLDHFRDIGAECFRVPREWFEEVFDSRTIERDPFRAWVGYSDGKPVVTAATVKASGAIGIYNVATVPDFRGRGYAEWLMREAIAREAADAELPLVLQSTAIGIELYARLGFRSVTRFRVWVS